ncbi:MAG: glycosyltransferase [Verrucomicrobia bacterium]|nr:glycosyltransferase [Verrucomicrobiota bacterium]MCH8513720.1 glycosyltransferase [Kiritimatiellia bacterium]
MQTIDELAREFLAKNTHDSSHVLLSTRQKAWYACVATAALWLLAYRWDVFVILFSCLSASAYLAVAVFKLWCVLLGMKKPPRAVLAGEQAERIPDEDLPLYTILVPLYREAAVLPHLTRNLLNLDYPTEKLDIKLLLEEDDPETVNAARALNLPECFELIVLPDAQPKTKPKACNHGLKAARGSYVVIFDAEDRPEPDQLRKVLASFKNAPADVICMQCRLYFFNATRNWLTRCFAVEYATWFNFYLEGLQHMRVPMPLGGTSNHFKTEVLREIGGWDPFNVTEDCDLGIRLYKRRYRTFTVHSTTWEEATSQTGNWIRQRSRWVKGYFQTYFTHMRHPLQTFRDLGLRGFCGFLLVVGGHSLLLVLNLVFWILALIYGVRLGQDYLAGRDLWEVIAGDNHAIRNAWKMIYRGPDEHWFLAPLSVAFFVVSGALLFANFIFLALGLAAVRTQQRRHLWPAALTMPVYWVLISIGAWKGFLQLFTRPFYWEKTRHGVDPDAHTPEELHHA